MSPQINEKILVVDSDDHSRDLIVRQTLQPSGYQVQTAEDAGSAIRLALQFQPDVIIADLNLSGLSGKDMLVAFSSQGINTPVIVMAEKGEEPKVIQAFRLGASDYFLRPIREPEVLSAVERALKQVRELKSRKQLDEQLKTANAELERRLRELTTIFSVGRAVISVTDQRVLFEKIVQAITSVSEADMGWLTLKEDKSNSFLMVAHRRLPDSWAKYIGKPIDDGVSALVAMSAESLSIHGQPLAKFKMASLGKSVMVVPIKVKQEVIGLMIVVRKAERAFGESEQTLLEAIADYASISLVNSRLFRAVAHSAEQAKAGEQRKYEALQQLRQETQSVLQSAIYPLEVVLGEKIGSLNDEQKQALTTIQSALKRLGFLIDQQVTQPKR
ncbi:MAG: response regulator [Anaerolineales bacterium]